MKEAKGGWEYKSRKPEDVRKRSQQRGGDFDSIWNDGFTTFSPKEGSHRLRILPPTWDNAKHFGTDVWVHYGVGADNQQYLCRAKMLDEECPLCKEAAKYSKDDEISKSLKPTRRVAYYVIDRKNEAAGVLVWAAPWTFDRDLSGLLFSEQNADEVLEIDNPDEGYDITFSRTGAQLATKYVSLAVSRHQSPLADDSDQAVEWLKFAIKNPIPTALCYYDADYILKVFNGGASKKEAAAPANEDAAPATRAERGRTRVAADGGDEDLVPPARATRAAQAAPAQAAPAKRTTRIEPSPSEDEPNEPELSGSGEMAEEQEPDAEAAEKERFLRGGGKPKATAAPAVGAKSKISAAARKVLEEDDE